MKFYVLLDLGPGLQHPILDLPLHTRTNIYISRGRHIIYFLKQLPLQVTS